MISRSIGVRNLLSRRISPQFRTITTTTTNQSPRFTNNSPFNRTRITKEISPEEVKRFQEQQQNQQQGRPHPYPHNFNTDPYYSFHIPTNTNGIITPQDPIYDILREPTLVIERQIEFMNLFIGFEQANRYIIMNAQGDRIGYMEEKDVGIGKMLGRQFFRLHRPFDIDVFTNNGELAMSIKRPFSFINSHIKALLPGYDYDNSLMYEVVGESVQSWHLWRRKYNLFKLEDEAKDEYEQFGAVDAPFLSFDFPVKNSEGEIIASVDRNWVGLGREMFTDTGVYVLRFDPGSFNDVYDGSLISKQGVTLDQRAVILSCFTSIDFDYFSRHSGGHGLFGLGGGGYNDV
ncbi:AIM25 Altered inheritance rate of mitochondria protein 25 [Candida maltosa Xu316]